MKKFMMILMVALMCCSCMLNDGNSSRHTADDLRSYASYSFNRYVMNTADKINVFLMLDDYLSATEEERLGNRFSYIRDGLVRTAENVYNLYYFGSIDTGGKSFRDESGNWKWEGLTYKAVAEDTWTVTNVGYLSVEATVKAVGLTESGTYVLEVILKAEEEAGFYATDSWSSHPPVKAVLSTDGPIVLKETYSEDSQYRTIRTLNGDGVFHVDIAREGTPIDWVTMEFSSEGDMTVSYRTSLD